MNGWIHLVGCMDEWMDTWMDTWMNEWIDALVRWADRLQYGLLIYLVFFNNLKMLSETIFICSIKCYHCRTSINIESYICAHVSQYRHNNVEWASNGD